MNSNLPLNRPTLASCSLVIFGATGDLTHRKLIPALYHLAVESALPANFRVIGFARRDKSDEGFREELGVTTRKFSRTAVDDAKWNRFAQSISYHRSEFHDLEGYCELAKKLTKEDAITKRPSNRLFYLAVAPDQIEVILQQLKASGLNMAGEGGWARVIIEKPFGVDAATASRLNELVHDAFPENATYRIDHYLGKETAQNIMVLRFANTIFESIWNSHHIHHVQITAAESLGVEGRAGYYDKAGALRDMVQNHLLQLLTLTAMEPPVSMSADAVRDEKLKVLRSLRPLKNEEVFKNVVRGQYVEGLVGGAPVIAYRQEEGVMATSTTESYVALRLAIDNWRWSGVPFFIRAGKRLPKACTEIAVFFKSVPPILFSTLGHKLDQNVLLIRIQPDEGISLGMSAKTPGSMFQIQPVKMNFQYGTSFEQQNPEAYERLLLDAMHGDATLFARSDEVVAAWKFIDGIEEAWLQSSNDLCFYQSGTAGPEEAHDLMLPFNSSWRKL
jgi:glucose-6-phosphate 1-dehydrogenase